MSVSNLHDYCIYQHSNIIFFWLFLASPFLAQLYKKAEKTTEVTFQELGSGGMIILLISEKYN
jgi:hypothetical protein